MSDRRSARRTKPSPRCNAPWRTTRSSVGLIIPFTTRQRVGNSHATCEQEQAVTLMVMATLPLLYAHRVGRDPGPDSSRAALRATLAGPVDGLETDACLTADGRLVLLHDPILSWHGLPRLRCAGWRARGRTAGVWRSSPSIRSRARRRAPRDGVAAGGVGGLCARRARAMGGACRGRRRLHRALPLAPCLGRAAAGWWSASLPEGSTTPR
jgi:hypothetical protein